MTSLERLEKTFAGESVDRTPVLGGWIAVCVPKTREDFRIVDTNSYIHSDKGMPVEEVLEWIDKQPPAAEIENSFDFNSEYARFKNSNTINPDIPLENIYAMYDAVYEQE